MIESFTDGDTFFLHQWVTLHCARKPGSSIDQETLYAIYSVDAGRRTVLYEVFKAALKSRGWELFTEPGPTGETVHGIRGLEMVGVPFWTSVQAEINRHGFGPPWELIAIVNDQVVYHLTYDEGFQNHVVWVDSRQAAAGQPITWRISGIKYAVEFAKLTRLCAERGIRGRVEVFGWDSKGKLVLHELHGDERSSLRIRLIEPSVYDLPPVRWDVKQADPEMLIASMNVDGKTIPIEQIDAAALVREVMTRTSPDGQRVARITFSEPIQTKPVEPDDAAVVLAASQHVPS